MTITETSTDTTVSYTNEQGYTTTFDKEILMGPTEPTCDTDEVWVNVDHSVNVEQIQKLPKGKTRGDISNVEVSGEFVYMTFTDGTEMEYEMDMSRQTFETVLYVQTSDGLTDVSYQQ